MNTISEPKRCPKCGGPIPPEAPQGLCPKCLLQQACVHTEAGKGESAKSAPPTHEQLAAAFPQLEILELIGQGGMGFVFKARQPKLERLVALKILPQSLAADPAFAERFTREGRMLARLNHPNIVAIHDFGQAGGFFYLLMEFVDGVNLRQAMEVGRFTPAQALSVVPRICEALQFAHNEGILHRDIKPENILLDTKGRVKVADFGVAKLLGEPHTDASLTASGAVLGTPHYMAPEQLEKSGEVDQRADIYSLGVVFYEMLTGELPLGKFQPPSEKVQVDVRLDEVVLHALEKEPARRYQQVSQVKTAVETLSGSPAAPAASIGTRPVVTAAAAPAQRPDRFWRRFALGVLALIMALIMIPVGIAVVGMLAAIAIPTLSKARDRARHQQSMAPLQTQTIPNLVFGPVIERLVNDVETGTDYLIDLDTGILFTLPPSMKFDDSVATESWYRKTGVDVNGKTKGYPSLCGRNLISQLVRADRWDNLTAAELSDFVERNKQAYAFPGSALGGSVETDIPTFLFKTREGGVGLLQLAGFADNPPGVKIRYKLVQNANAQPGKTVVPTAP